MKEGTLFLHIGTHKTGTTSIQKALRLKEQKLSQEGIAIYGQDNAWDIANTFLRPNLMTTPRVTGRAQPPTSHSDLIAPRRRLQKMRGAHRDMIVSSEEFCLMREALEGFAVKSVLGRWFANIVIVAAFRNLEDWRASRHDQLRKTGQLDTQTALSDEESTNGNWYYDPPAIKVFWGQIGDIVTLDYDLEMQKNGSILPGFADAIGQPGLFDGLDLHLNTRTKHS